MDVNGLISDGGARLIAARAVRNHAGITRSQDQSNRTGGEAPAAPPVRSNDSVRQFLDRLADERAANTRAGSRLRLDASTDRVVVQIVNGNNEVIRQIPPEEALKIAARYRDLVGLIFDQQV